MRDKRTKKKEGLEPEPEPEDTSKAQAELDRELRNAQRSIRRALDVCVRVTRGRHTRRTAGARRAEGLKKRLAQALQLLDGSRLSSGVDTSDPDLALEASKFPGWHRDRK